MPGTLNQGQKAALMRAATLKYAEENMQECGGAAGVREFGDVNTTLREMADLPSVSLARLYDILTETKEA